MIFSFPKLLRLRTRYDFKRMISRSKRYSCAFFAIDARKNEKTETRLGIIVTRRFGKANRRNRFKRIVREAFRLCYNDLIKGLDLCVRPYQDNPLLTMQQVQYELLRFFKKDE